MEPEKDVLDGWCMYLEKSVATGSNSSDSESIEIISEDEAGNFQIYSKNYFRPESTTADLTQGNKTNGDSPSVTPIKEYCENDPTQFIVEEGKEAQEKEDSDDITRAIKKKTDRKKFKLLQPEDSCEHENKTVKDSVLEVYHSLDMQLTELVDFLHSSDEPEVKKRENVFENQNKDEMCNNILLLEETRSETITITAPPIDSKSSRNTAKRLSDEEFKVSNQTGTKGTANEVVELSQEHSAMSEEDERVTESNTESVGAVKTEAGEFTVTLDLIQDIPNNRTEGIEFPMKCRVLRETETSISESTNNSSEKCRMQEKVSPVDRPSTSPTDEIIVLSATSCQPTSVKKAQMGKQIFASMEDTTNLSPKKYRKHNVQPLSRPSTTSTDETRPPWDPISVKKSRKKLISARKARNSLSLGGSGQGTNRVSHPEPPDDAQVSPSSNSPSDSMTVQPDSTGTEKDISTLVLISVVVPVLYLLYSALVEPNLTSIVPESKDRVPEDNSATVHGRYFQLVADWEAKVLENAELDYRIALKEKSEKLSHAARQNISLETPPRVSLPDCMARHILTHTFGFLRQYPPDIADLASWSKTKFCVDLSLLLTPMRTTSFSAVLKLLTFLASPSSELNYQAVFDHYLSQQKIHIHDVIQRDYPEIYRSKTFFRPDEKLRPQMYCVSMHRFSVLKNKYAPREDNMGALLRLSELYVQNEACLQAMVSIEGVSVDRLYDFAVDVLVSRSISTAITLDPSLLHDYYLELILSNEANLKKLSRQLFKYNVLAIQKFNLTLEEKPVIVSKRNFMYKHRTHQNEEDLYGLKRELTDKKKFLLVRDGDDDILILDRMLDEDWRDQQDQPTKLVTLDKADIELFYDSQLREISNGYSSKVRKFLADINKDLKHALCYPYANDVEETAPLSEKNESLVRFIRNMCRTNVLKATMMQKMETDEMPNVTSEKHSGTLQEVSVKTKLETNENTHHSCNNNLSEECTSDSVEILENKDEVVDSDDGFVEIKISDFKTEDTPEPSYSDPYNFHVKENQPPALLNPDSHVFRDTVEKDQVLLNPDEQRSYVLPSQGENRNLLNPDYHTGYIGLRQNGKSQEDLTEGEYERVRKSLRKELDYNIRELKVLNKMANRLGRNDVEEETHNAYNTKILEDVSVERAQKDMENEISLREQMTHRRREITRILEAQNDMSRRHHHDSIWKHFKEKKDHVRLNKLADERNERVSAYDSRPNSDDRTDSRPNSDDRTDRHNSRSGEHGRSSREERIVHIDGLDNVYTRHVYIDNGKAGGSGRLSRQDGEMDWWFNRRARLRAKLRKKRVYPVQNNPEYQYDYLYE